MNRLFITLSLLIGPMAVSLAQTTAPSSTTPTSQTAPANGGPAIGGPARSPLRVIDHTQYTDRSELFAEFRPLLLNVPGRFTAHLTRLGEQGFKPYTDAEVTLTLTVGSKMAWQQTLTKPTAPGIYRFPVKAETTGTGRITLDLKTPDYTEQFVVENVTVYADEAAALAAGQGRKDEPTVPGEVAYYKEKSWLETFATAPVSVVKKAIIVPKTALLSDQDSRYVYVQTDPEHFRKQAVQTGEENGNTITIKSGLKAGDRIVTFGAEKIK